MRIWRNLPRKITKGKEFDYFPRGRVEKRNGKYYIFINPLLNIFNIVSEIFRRFDICADDIIYVKVDGFKHYEAYEESSKLYKRRRKNR